MKFTKLLALLILASCVLTSHLKRKVKKTSAPIKHSIIALGDIGQIDQFFKSNSISNALKEINEAQTPAKIVEKIKKFSIDTDPKRYFIYDIKEEFNYNSICNHQGKPLDLTLNNFAPVLKNIEQETFDEAVVLGDAVYTEGKNLANILKGSLAIEKIEGEFKLPEMAKYAESDKKHAHLKETKAEPKEKKEGQIDTIETRMKNALGPNLIKRFLVELDKKNSEELKSLFTQFIFVEFVRRLYCAWQKVISIFTESTKLKNPSIVFGNHSMDVKYSLEVEQISKFTPWNVDNDKNIRDTPVKYSAKGDVRKKWDKIFQDMMDRPKVTLVKKGEKNEDFILYLDFDMSKLICADYLDGEKNKEYGNDGVKLKDTISETEEIKQINFLRCLKTRFVGGYPQYYTKEDQISMFKIHTKYYNNLKEILLGKEVVNSKATWKIVRVHQPIFNIERDFSGVKQNRVLMGLFRNAGIHFWMVSHHHSAQVNIARYENYGGDNYKYKVLGDSIGMRGEANEFLDPLKEEAKAAKLTVYNGTDDYFFTKTTVTENGKTKDKITLRPNLTTIINKAIGPEMIDRSEALLKDCTVTGDKKICNIKISKEKNDYIIQLLAGNGGRLLDPLMSDLFTDSVLLFGKSRYNEFGYYKIDFEGDSALVTFKSNGTEDFVFKISQVDKADDAMNFKFLQPTDKKSIFESLLENKFNSVADKLKELDKLEVNPKVAPKVESKVAPKVESKVEPKPTEAKVEVKPTEAKVEPKPTEAKVEAKPTEAKVEAKPTEAKVEEKPTEEKKQIKKRK